MDVADNFFESWYEEFIRTLKAKQLYESVISKFERLTLDEERVSEVLNLESDVKIFQIKDTDFVPDMKSASMSKSLRNEGNKAFKQDYRQALELYSDALRHAPDPSTNTEGTVNTNDLALAYANRSAVLFHLGEYEACLTDIKYAFHNGYPENLKYKLHDRKGRCYLQIEDVANAGNSLENAMEALEYAKLDDTKKKDWEADLKKEIGHCISACQSGAGGAPNVADKQENWDSQMPSFQHGTNPVFGSLSSSCDVAYTDDQGRYITAIKDIEPGEIILIEKPFSSVVLPETYSHHCHHCFCYCTAPFPCFYCKTATYCSIDCRQNAWFSYHESECSILYFVHKSGVDKFGHLALRTVTSAGLPYLLRNKTDICGSKIGAEKGSDIAVKGSDGAEKSSDSAVKDSEKDIDHAEKGSHSAESGNESAEEGSDTGVIGSKKDGDHNEQGNNGAVSHTSSFLLDSRKLLGCNKDGKYCADDYKAINSLVTHDKDRTPEDLLRRSAMAVFLLHGLRLGGFFIDDGDKQLDTPENLSYIGGLILSHLQLLPCNAHEISEMQLELADVANSAALEIGAGIYSTLSLFNHSCDPAVNRNFYGDACVVRAIRFIQKGEEISDNYGALYPVHDRETRHEKLQSQYFFKCSCKPCSENWPLYPEIRLSSPTWLCQKCSAMLIGDRCAKCRDQMNIQAMKSKLETSSKAFATAFTSLLQGEIGQALPICCQHLSTVQSHVELPWKDFNNCQEALKQCLGIMGNCHKVKS